MKNKGFLFVAILCLIVTVSGCSGNESEKEDTVQVESEETSEELSTSESTPTPTPVVTSITPTTRPTNTPVPESTEEVWIPITDPSNAPDDWKNQAEPPYCLGCGKTKKEVYISRHGYCDTCFKMYMEPKMPHCDTCGEVLEGGGYLGNRHPQCYHCDYCGGAWNESYGDHWDASYGFACCECYIEQVIGCSQCGYKGEMSTWESGMCDSCLQEWEQQESQIYCTYCGQPTTNPDPQYGLCPSCLQMKNEIENYENQ